MRHHQVMEKCLQLSYVNANTHIYKHINIYIIGNKCTKYIMKSFHKNKCHPALFIEHHN